MTKQEYQKELYRVRTTQAASAHALDCLRQDLKLDLIRDEHPMDLYKRIREKIRAISSVG